MSNQQRQRKEPWRNNSERHYCTICNAWMASDRQSILLHENGKKHLDNQEKVRQQKRQEKQKEEEQQNFLQKSLQQMEQTALQSHLQQDHLVAASSLLGPVASNSAIRTGFPPSVVQSSNLPRPPPPPPPPQLSKKEMNQEKEEWKKRRKQRENDHDNANQDETTQKSKKRRIEPDQGHYEYNGKIYLEGLVFGELLEEDMPVQLWTGSSLASLQEKKLPERDMYWKNGMVVGLGHEKVHVAYLASQNDVDETVEKNVPLDRIRIILGADESIPDTLEEARLMAMGGEEIQVVPSGQASSSNNTAIDEATGLSSWSTVTIKRTTVRQEVKEERKKMREKRKQALAEQEAKEKEIAARKMEEAKAANADDSALGSIYFAELGREVQGYKGVDISDTGDDKLTIQDTAKSLAAGKVSVGFKKRVKRPMANRSQRTTSADDE